MNDMANQIKMKVTTKRLAVCRCGHTVLEKNLPLGTEYCIYPAVTTRAVWTCGGCKRSFAVKAVYAENRDGVGGGWLPSLLFEVPRQVPGKRRLMLSQFEKTWTITKSLKKGVV